MGFLDRVVEAIWETLDEFQGGPDRPSRPKKTKKKKATEVDGGAGQTAAETVFESTEARD